MEKLDDKTVRHVADLARLGVSEEDVVKFATELAAILDYVERLRRVDVASTEPLAHVTGHENASREDRAGDPIVPHQDHDLLEEQAPGHKDGEVRVPRVLS